MPLLRGATFRLRWKIQLTLVCLSAIPLCAVMLIASVLIERQIAGEIRQRLNEVANFVERTVIYSQKEYSHYLEQLTENREIAEVLVKAQQGERNAPVVRDFLTAGHEKLAFDIVELLDAEGEILLRSVRRGEIPASSGKDHPVVEASLDGESTYEIDLFDGRLALTAAAPVRIDGQIAGHLVGARFLDAEIAQQMRALSGVEVAFFDGGGVYAASLPELGDVDLAIFTPTAEELREVREGTVRSRQIRNLHLAGSPYALTTISLGGSRLGILLALDSSDLLTANARLKTFLSIVLAAVIALAALIGFLISRQITRPLIRVVGNLKEISEGEADLTRELEVLSRDEVGELATAFNGFVGKLRGMVGRMLAASAELVNAAERLKGTSLEVREGASRQAVSLADSFVRLKNLEQVIGDIAAGTGVLVKSTEEGSSATLEMKATSEEIAAQMERLFSIVEEVSAAIRQMSLAGEQVMLRIQSLSGSAEATSVSVTEMAASIRQIEGNAEQTRNLSETAARDARQGRLAVADTLAGIGAVSDLVGKAGDALETLEKHSRAIGRILSTIDEIATQTRLLALNASIIAAQAGESGKGFAVVADEIGNLAQRTAASTREVDSLIKALQQGTRDATEAMRLGRLRVQQEVERSGETGLALEKLFASATTSAEQVRQIVRAAGEHARESGKVTAAMHEVAEMLNQIVAVIQEQTDGNRSLARSAEGMRHIASQVKISTEEQAAGSRQIGVSMEKILAMAAGIDAATRDHARNNREILVAIDGIRDIGENNRVRTREMDEVVEILGRQTAVLDEEIGAFKIGKD